MRLGFFTVILIFTIFSCRVNKESDSFLDGLHLLSLEQHIENGFNGNIPLKDEIKFLNKHGEEVTRDSMIERFGLSNLGFDSYANVNDKVEIIIIREAIKGDSINQTLYMEAMKKGPILKDTSFDCSKLNIVLEEVTFSDQKNREKGIEYIDLDIDNRNLRIVLFALEHCVTIGTLLSKNEIESIWLILQHNRTKYAKKYFPLLQEYVESKILDERDLLMMLDRILLDDGEPQLYGTQICKNTSLDKWELCETTDVLNLNERRKEKGFEPIEEYLKNWNIILPEKFFKK